MKIQGSCHPSTAVLFAAAGQLWSCLGIPENIFLNRTCIFYMFLVWLVHIFHATFFRVWKINFGTNIINSVFYVSRVRYKHQCNIL